jgi:hypothetical protein
MGLFAAAQSVRICSTKSRARFSHGALGIEAAMLEALGLDARGLEASGHDRCIADGRIQSIDREVHRLFELIPADTARPEMPHTPRAHALRPFRHGQKCITLFAAREIFLAWAVLRARMLEFHRQSSLIV